MDLPQSSRVRDGWRALWVLLALGVVVYSNSFVGEYHFDDHYNIRENLFVHDLGNIWRYFIDAATTSSLPENAPYRPLSTVSFALLWAAGGGATWPFHVFKLVAHVLVAFCSYLIARSLLDRSPAVEANLGAEPQIALPGGRRRAVDAHVIALLGAMLFVLHPCMAESVNYISSLTSVQCTLLYLLAFWCFLGGRIVPMAVLFFLSVLTKEEGASFPLVVFLFQIMFTKKRFKPFNLPLITAFLVLFAYLGLRAQFGSKTVVFGVVAPHLYFFTQLRAWIYYIYKIFTPWGYSVEHMNFGFSQSFFEPWVMASAVVVALGAWRTLSWAWPRKGHLAQPFLAFGVGWYIAGLSPSSSFFPLFEPIFEHRYYLSFTLFFPALVYGLFRLVLWIRLKFLVQPRVLSAVVGITFCGLSALTLRQNIIWRHEFTLWQDVVDLDPANGRAINNLAVAYINKGDYERALSMFERSEQAAPGYKYAMIGQLTCLRQLGRIDAARIVVNRLVTASDGTDTPIVHYFHALFLIENEKRPEEALPVLARCAEVSGGKSANCMRLELIAYRDLGLPDKLKEAGARALQYYSDDREMIFEYGLALIKTGQLKEAQKVFADIFARDGDAQSLQNLAWLDLQLGDFEGAKAKWRQKLQLIPGDSAAIENLRLLEAKAP